MISRNFNGQVPRLIGFILLGIVLLSLADGVQGFHTAYGSSPLLGPAAESCTLPQAVNTPLVIHPGDDWLAAIENAPAGTTMLLRGGSYDTAGQIRPRAGTSSRPLTIKPYNCEAVTISGSWRPQSHTVLAGLTLRLPTSSPENWTIRLDGKNLGQIEGVTLRHNVIQGGQIDAIRISDQVSQVLISGNRLDGGRDGHVLFVTSEERRFYPDQITIENNFLSKSYFKTPSEDMIQVRDADTVVIRHNTCADGWRMEQCIDLKSMRAPAVIEYNLFDGDTLHQGGAGEDGAAGCMVIHEKDGRPENHRIEHNYFRNCQGTTIRFAPGDTGDVSRATVRYNVFIHPSNDAEAYVMPIWQAQNVLFEHNTFVRGHLKLGDSNQNKLPVNTRLEHNIFYQTRFDDSSTAAENTICRHNLFYQVITDKLPPGRCTDTISGDPKFLNLGQGDVHLVSGSPAIGTAANGWDLGAYPLAHIDLQPAAYLPLVVR